MDILLVEDNLLNQKVVSHNLKKHNYSVTAVTNGHDAINMFINNKYKLILMDIMLPDMNGYEIVEAIRKYEQREKNEYTIPVIAITANTLEKEREKCLVSGMDDYLSKPFTTKQLIEKIRIFID